MSIAHSDIEGPGARAAPARDRRPNVSPQGAMIDPEDLRHGRDGGFFRRLLDPDQRSRRFAIEPPYSSHPAAGGPREN